jgi:hypothetical protein
MPTRPYSIYLGDAIKVSPTGDGTQYLDSGILLSALGNVYSSVDNVAVINITDGNENVSFTLNSFLSKNYDIENDKIKFGFKRIKVNGFRVSITCDIEFSKDR